MPSLEQCRAAIAKVERRLAWLRAEVARQEALPTVCGCGAPATVAGRCQPCAWREANMKRLPPPCRPGRRHAWDAGKCLRCGVNGKGG